MPGESFSTLEKRLVDKRPTQAEANWAVAARAPITTRLTLGTTRLTLWTTFQSFWGTFQPSLGTFPTFLGTFPFFQNGGVVSSFPPSRPP